MTLTEEEVGAKRCCGPIGCGAVSESVSSQIRGAETLVPRYCIASECMAWRWTIIADWTPVYNALKSDKIVDAVKEYRALFGTSLKDSLDAVRAIDLNKPMPPSVKAGYCGLAGKP